MKTDEYYQLLYDGKPNEAEEVRQSTIPDKLVKFISLDGTKTDEMKFCSLQKSTLWFSHSTHSNDPREYKGMQIDEQKLLAHGYSQDCINQFKSLLDFSDYGLTCLSTNTVDYFPMWAYYANDHHGFCIEYDVLKKDCIHEVLYEPETIKLSSLIFPAIKSFKHAMFLGRDSKSDFYLTIFLQALFIKDASWSHEREYRIVYPLRDCTGVNVPVSDLGLKAARIIVGNKCSSDNVQRIRAIAKTLDLEVIYEPNI